MLRAPMLFALAASLALSCDFGADVAHRGAYGFLPTAAIPDTALRPLRFLLVVEEDPASERTLFYYFEGDLGRAGIGLESLPRIAARHGRSAMRFTPPLETFAIPKPITGGEGGAGGAAGGSGSGAGSGSPGESESAGGAAADDGAPGEGSAATSAGGTSESSTSGDGGAAAEGSASAESNAGGGSGTAGEGAAPVESGTAGEGGASHAEGGAGGDSGETVAPRETLDIELEGHTERVTLERIEAFELEPTGASRFVTTLGTEPVRAFFGVRHGTGTLPPLRVVSEAGPLRFTPELRAVAPMPAREDTLVAVDYEASADADYLIVDLFQTIHRSADSAPFEAIVGMSLAPSTRYLASPALLDGAFELGCWSFEKPLSVRVTQVARAYAIGADGDFAVVHHRHDVASVPDTLWSEAIASVRTAAYCADFY